MVQGCSVQRQLFFPLGRIIVVVHKAATAVPKSVEEVLGLKLAEVTTEEETRIWNELILREHPLYNDNYSSPSRCLKRKCYRKKVF